MPFSSSARPEAPAAPGQHGLHRAGGGVVDVDAAGAGVSDQLRAQGALHAVLRRDGGGIGEVDAPVGPHSHGGGAGEGGTVDLGHDLFGGGTPAVVPGAAEGPAAGGDYGVPDVAVRVKIEAGDLALRRQDGRKAAAVLPHPQQRGPAGAGVGPVRQSRASRPAPGCRKYPASR